MAGERITELTAAGDDERAAVVAGLRAILTAARGEVAGAGEGATAAAIRGQGADLGTVFFELANDLLAQLDANGGALSAVRLDGLLRTADGYTAWGYALGDPAPGGTLVNVTIDEVPTVERVGEQTRLRVRLRQS